MSGSKYDLVVIGGGSGGVRAARLAAETGARVALVEEKRLGGTCVNVGCVPKKLFAFSAHYAEDFRDSRGFGWSAADPSFDFGLLRDNKDREIARLNLIYGDLLGKAGVEVVEGRAHIGGPGLVAVEGRELACERILVATGSYPSPAPFSGSEHAISSDDIFHISALPKAALVVGGGYIAVEFASILAGWGVATTLVHRGARILTRFDSAVAQFVQDELAKKGVMLQMNDQIDKVERSGGDVSEITFKSGDRLEVGLVLCALGRRPGIDGLGLKEVGVAVNAKGAVEVDGHFRTSCKGVFALGDVIGRVALTPVAIAEAKVFVAQEFRGEDVSMDYGNIATAVFCNPNIGTVGMTEEQAKEKGIDCEILQSEFRHMRHNLSGSEERTLMKVIVSKQDDRVIGMHMAGADAGEIIQGFAAALKCGMTSRQLHSTVGIHPTAAEEFVTI